MVKAVEQNISTRQEMGRILEELPIPRADSSNRCRRMKFCENRGKWEEFGRRETKGNIQGEDPRTFEENSQVNDTRTYDGRSHQLERWRVQEKRKEEKWKNGKKKKKKKKVKHRQRKRWKRCKKEIVISLCMMTEEKRKGNGKQK